MPAKWLRVGILAAVVASVTVSCGLGNDYHGMRFENGTTETVTVVSENTTGEATVVPSLAPGAVTTVAGFPGATCGDLTLIARTSDGREVARRDNQRTCIDDVWKIVTAPTSS